MSAASAPNLLLIFTDMQRWDTIHALGNPHIRTPALDSLVREGTSFTSCYSPSPVCISARYAMQYGMWPSRSGVTENQSMPADTQDSYAQRLTQSGYRTHAIGKVHFTPDAHALRGFTSREAQEEVVASPGQDDYLRYLFSQGYAHIRDPHGVRGEMYYIPQVAQMPAEHHPSQWIADRSLDFIGKAKPDQPWMLMSSFIHPHPPFAVPNPWHKLYRSVDMPLPSMPQDYPGLLTWINHMQNRYKYRDQGFDRNLLRLIKAYYYACISFVDHQIGRILACLEERRQLERTLIVFTSDHGEFLGDYGCFGKRSMHDPSSRVPLIVRLPGYMPADCRITTPVSLVDVPVTLLRAAGAPTHQPFVGVDLMDVSHGRSQRSIVFSQCGANGVAQYMAVTAKHKYFYSAPDGREFLFDRQLDPGELRNRAGLDATRHIVRGMRKRLLTFLKEQGTTAAFEVAANGELSWRAWPHLSIDPDPDQGLGMLDHPWAIQDIEGYTEAVPPMISGWQVIGPFPGEVADEHLLAQDTALEAHLRERGLGDGSMDLSWSVALGGSGGSAGKTLCWKHASSNHRGAIDLVAAIGACEHVIAYGYTEIASAEARPAMMSCGSDDGIMIWLNGVLVHRNCIQRSFLCDDDDDIPITLQAGVNRILVKVDNRVGGWGFGVRVR